MSENVSLNGEALTDEKTGEIAGEVAANRDSTNQMEENSASIEAKASEINTNEVASGYNVDRNEEAIENDIGERVASLSFNSDSAEKSYVTADGGKVEDNSPASSSCKTDTVADAEHFEEGQNGIPAPEENPFLQSVKYLEKHQILRLFQVRFVLRIIHHDIQNTTGRTK